MTKFTTQTPTPITVDPKLAAPNDPPLLTPRQPPVHDECGPRQATVDPKLPNVVMDFVATDVDGLSIPARGERRFQMVEIYDSVKGEGTQVGMPMTFVRFSKCNLACTWCDTPYNRVAIELTAAELVANILGRDPAWVVFTGGEPCLQLNPDITRPLKVKGVRLAIETNGMVWTDALMDMDYVNISPKPGQPIHVKWENFARHHKVNEVRFTITKQDLDIWNPFTGKYLDQYQAVVLNAGDRKRPEDLLGLDAEYITISPVFDPPTTTLRVHGETGWKSGDGHMMGGVYDRTSLSRALMLVHRYRHANARLSLQAHKFIGAR